ncbi:hypothetical protein C8J57DRAFT_1515323 [Mycena rebaudengoi]|nr:hypothetical protein C8J57DRAFT_1515323 [Mycena rebaudengoi]
MFASARCWSARCAATQVGVLRATWIMSPAISRRQNIAFQTFRTHAELGCRNAHGLGCSHTPGCTVNYWPRARCCAARVARMKRASAYGQSVSAGLGPRTRARRVPTSCGPARTRSRAALRCEEHSQQRKQRCAMPVPVAFEATYVSQPRIRVLCYVCELLYAYTAAARRVSAAALFLIQDIGFSPARRCSLIRRLRVAPRAFLFGICDPRGPRLPATFVS